MRTRKTNKAPGSREFLKELQSGRCSNVILLYGEEDYLIAWAVEQLKETYVSPATAVMDYQVLNGKEEPPETILHAAETFPVMSERRVVWVRDFTPVKAPGAVAGFGEEGIGRLVDYMEHPNENAVVVFSNVEIDGTRKLAKAFKKYGSVYEMGPVTERELVGFASKQFRRAKVTVAPSQMDQIIAATGYLNKESSYRLYDFRHDIEKLIALSEEGAVKTEDIPLAVQGDKDTFLFDLIDNISRNDKAGALEILYHRMSDDPGSGIPLTAAILSQMELMYCIREYMDSADGPSGAEAISKTMGVHEFRVKKAMQYSSRYTRNKLKEMLQSGYKAYGNIVTGLLEPRMALELFIAQI